MRVLFRKGLLGSIGSVAWMFDQMGVVEATHADGSLDLDSVAIEAGAQNVEPLDASDVQAGQTGARFFCDPIDLDSVQQYLNQQGWVVTFGEKKLYCQKCDRCKRSSESGNHELPE